MRFVCPDDGVKREMLCFQINRYGSEVYFEKHGEPMPWSEVIFATTENLDLKFSREHQQECAVAALNSGELNTDGEEITLEILEDLASVEEE